MALQPVLDDGEPETGAAGLARTADVDAVKAFSEARDVLRRVFSSGRHRRGHRAARIGEPTQRDASADRRITHGIRHEIGEGAVQLLLRAAQQQVRLRLQYYLMF